MARLLTYPEYYPKLLEFLKTLEPPSTTDLGLKYQWEKDLTQLDSRIQRFSKAHTAACEEYDRFLQLTGRADPFFDWSMRGASYFVSAFTKVEDEVKFIHHRGRELWWNFEELLSENGVDESVVHREAAKKF